MTSALSRTSVAVVLCSLVTACGPDAIEAVGQRRDALTLLSIEAETWASSGVVITDAAASGGQALKVASMTRDLTPGAPGTSLSLRTRADFCGTATARVRVNGIIVATLVSGASYVTTTITTALPSAFSLTLEYIGGCRTIIDTVVVEGPTLPPPPPTFVTVQAESATGAGLVEPPYRRFTAVGSASAAFTLAGTATSLTAPATGVRCAASPLPRLILSVDGTTVLDSLVSTLGVTTLFTNVSIPAGAHTLTFTYAGDTNTAFCNGSMSVDKVTFTVP
ncbi:MAG: hypothetical protein Q8S33_02030 [Myxococcales bacterium]|nr:hypothetical protein [Myxococcales bacterium]MDP3499075.1 hypothetical protein [Myxococcales bacterium]